MWPDKETNIDYLNFRYLVDLIVEIAINRELTPSTIGLYGDWGSGKSSLMKLAQDRIEELSNREKSKETTVRNGCITCLVRIEFPAVCYGYSALSAKDISF